MGIRRDRVIERFAVAQIQHIIFLHKCLACIQSGTRRLTHNGVYFVHGHGTSIAWISIDCLVSSVFVRGGTLRGGGTLRPSFASGIVRENSYFRWWVPLNHIAACTSPPTFAMMLELACYFPADEPVFFEISINSDRTVSKLMKAVYEELKDWGQNTKLQELSLYQVRSFALSQASI